LARHIAQGVRLQVEFDKWSGVHPDLEKRLRARYPTVHRNVWSRWRQKVEALRAQPWDAKTEAHLGLHLIHCLVEAAPTRFRVENRPVKGKPTAHLTLSDETLELITDVQTRMEVARPLRMPMICPPLPWRYEE
jgi:hypothetical protein